MPHSPGCKCMRKLLRLRVCMIMLMYKNVDTAGESAWFNNGPEVVTT